MRSFFDRYPVSRKLLSLNKAHTGTADEDFNLRYDWHSLLGEPGVASVPSRTDDLYPQADVVAEYLRDYARKQEQNIRYRHEVPGLHMSKLPA